MFRLNKIQRLAVSIFIPILSVPIYGELILWIYKPKYLFRGRQVTYEPILKWDYALFDYPAAIITFMVLMLVFELYLWRTIQPRKKRALPILPTIKEISFFLVHLFASIIISIALSSNHAFKEYFGADDEESTAILLFFLYWSVFIVIPWGVRRGRTKLKTRITQETEVKDTSNDNLQKSPTENNDAESQNTKDDLPEISRTHKSREYKKFGDDLTKIENVKVRRNKNEDQ